MPACHMGMLQGIDDFIARVEVALCGFGFTGQNSIGRSSCCRPGTAVSCSTSAAADEAQQQFQQ